MQRHWRKGHGRFLPQSPAINHWSMLSWPLEDWGVGGRVCRTLDIWVSSVKFLYFLSTGGFVPLYTEACCHIFSSSHEWCLSVGGKLPAGEMFVLWPYKRPLNVLQASPFITCAHTQAHTDTHGILKKYQHEECDVHFARPGLQR